VPLSDAVTDGLGDRWHTDTLSFKIRPGGPGIDAAVDCAVDLHRDLLDAGVSLDRDIARVQVDASLYTLFAGRRAEQYLSGRGTPIGSLLLTAPYSVATALLGGDLTVADFAEPALGDARRWALAAQVRLTHDEQMTRSLFNSVAPFGEAVRQAGPQAAGWLASFGAAMLAPEHPSVRPTFEHATKKTPARVTVHLSDGREFARERDIPLGAAGPRTRGEHSKLMRAKFLSHGGPVEVADAFDSIVDCTAGDLSRLLPLALAP
jgi:2-methylcitrate dehydratase PrpD